MKSFIALYTMLWMVLSGGCEKRKDGYRILNFVGRDLTCSNGLLNFRKVEQT